MGRYRDHTKRSWASNLEITTLSTSLHTIVYLKMVGIAQVPLRMKSLTLV